MDATIYFPFVETWWIYAGFCVLVLMMLALDLGVFHRKAHVVSMRESIVWSIVWVSLASLVNLGFWAWARHDLGERGLDPALDWSLAIIFGALAIGIIGSLLRASSAAKVVQ